MNDITDSLADRILLKLKNGHWIMDSLEPPFRDSLAAKVLGPQNQEFAYHSTTYLTARHYRNLLLFGEEPQTTRPCLSLQGRQVGQPENNLFWENAARVVNPKAELDDVDSHWRKTCDEAIKLIERVAPETFQVLQNSISYLCTLKSCEFRSASHPHFLGTLFLRKNDDTQSLAISIIHELAHQELFLINLIDRLIPQGSDYSLAHAPYQGQARPPIGRLHSGHALFRMISFERTIGHKNLAPHIETLKQTVGSFTDEELTPYAKKVLLEVY